MFISTEHNPTDTMESKQLKSFLASHPKLLEFAFAGTLAGSTILVETNGASGYPGP